jgi:hypothetical protein
VGTCGKRRKEVDRIRRLGSVAVVAFLLAGCMQPTSRDILTLEEAIPLFKEKLAADEGVDPATITVDSTTLYSGAALVVYRFSAHLTFSIYFEYDPTYGWWPPGYDRP